MTKLKNRPFDAEPPWKARIEEALESTLIKCKQLLRKHYENIKSVLGRNWGGNDGYAPSIELFYRR